MCDPSLRRFVLLAAMNTVVAMRIVLDTNKTARNAGTFRAREAPPTEELTGGLLRSARPRCPGARATTALLNPPSSASRHFYHQQP